jgi:hypothetical protein
MKICIVTIVSGNYLAYAKVLGESVKQNVPEAEFRVLVVDRLTSDIDIAAKESGLNLTYAAELGISDIERIAYKYDIMELNTALKPTFLKRAFADGFTHVIYLDPDIQLFAPMTPVFEAMECANITLIPHALRPVLDGMRPSDVDFLRAGTFNLGFIALHSGDQTREMLDWWESRCLGLGFNDTTFGTFVDQKWIDLVPCYFQSVNILRHPGCNVAYWNLHEREISWAGGCYTVNGEQLVFFHFSGVIADRPQELSKHQTRHMLTHGSPLAGIVARYCQSLLDAGHASLSKIPYSFGRLDDGTVITSVMRRALCCFNEAEASPFNPSSQLQRRLWVCNITPTAKISGRQGIITTHNFNESDLRVKAVNTIIRILARLIGINRTFQLLRYASLLTREMHFSAVLMKEPLDLRHISRR